jgi:hypothetical protein
MIEKISDSEGSGYVRALLKNSMRLASIVVGNTAEVNVKNTIYHGHLQRRILLNLAQRLLQITMSRTWELSEDASPTVVFDLMVHVHRRPITERIGRISGYPARIRRGSG